MAGLHDMILLVNGYFAILLFVESGRDGRFESSSISLHASYRILIIFNWDDIQLKLKITVLGYFRDKKNKFVVYYGIAKQIVHLSTRIWWPVGYTGYEGIHR